MKHVLASIRFVLTALLLCVPAGVPGAEEKLSTWKHFPEPKGTPKVRRPPDSEFLKLLPPLRVAPKLDESAHRRGFAHWWGDYSEQLFSEQPPREADLRREPVVTTPAGEDEPLVLGLWGLRDLESVTLSVEESPFPISVRRVDFNPRSIPSPYDNDHVAGGRIVGLASYLLPESEGRVSAGANTVFWLTVSVPAEARPDRYAATLELRVTSTGESLSLPITIEVLGYQLPRADIAFGMYYRPTANAKLPERYRPMQPEALRPYWRDMARHGMTSATIYNYAGSIHDSEGNARFDGNSDIRVLQDMMAEGLVHADVPVMWLGSIDERAGPAVAAEAKRRGFPELLIYGPDEPAVNDQSLNNFRGLQALRKSFRIVTAISDEAAAAYGDLLDCWVVNGGCVTPEIRRLAAEKKAELWTYDCNHRGAGNAPRSRYYAGLYTWAFRLKGNFLWCYTESYYRENGRYLPWGPIYCFVLPSDQGLLASIEWEARREGVEDYRTCRLLEQRIAANPDSPVAREALSWLQETRARVDWYLARNMPPHLYPWDGPELYPTCPDFAPTELSGLRRQMADFILKLQ